MAVVQAECGKVEIVPHGRARCRLTCLSRCSSSLRVCWKMILTREIESLVARCPRAKTVHDKSAVVAVVQGRDAYRCNWVSKQTFHMLLWLLPAPGPDVDLARLLQTYLPTSG